VLKKRLNGLQTQLRDLAAEKEAAEKAAKEENEASFSILPLMGSNLERGITMSF